ncbi:methyl-accepting chemotaxis protein [Geomonas sp. Red32]|uniref:methyl-accepting chemotaxis protein n=1 Tax=Geomonas sp. Red32 TaxID=2912856 RepID=UPI002545EEBE|nr:methyl-accepting chemotaxis protein [Geomonas sp. Red32]
MKRVTQMTFRNKLLILVLASSLGLSVPIGLISLQRLQESYAQSTAAFQTRLYADFDLKVKDEVLTAVTMLQDLEDRRQQGELTLEEAKRLGANGLRKLKYGKDGYFWADTTEGVNVVLLGKPAEGKSRIDLKDAKGKPLIRDMIRIATEGGGFYDYYFPRPGSDTPFPKRAYVAQFKPFGWVIGTGNYVDDLDAIVQETAGRNHRAMVNGAYLIAGVTALILLITVGAVVATVRQLIRQIGTEPRELEEIAKKVAAGDLTVDLVEGRSGIYEAMRKMIADLKRVMERVNQGAHEISAAAVQLDATAHQTAENSRLVVSQAETVSVASEEMSATSSDIANNCHAAAGSSQRATSSAEAGAGIVADTVDGMNRIADRVKSSAGVVEQLGTRSDQIGEIVATIEDIADQTNLLALNAAIEAARAGEQGRGFAVVADEVRALAERTTRATKEIGSMIRSIQQETRTAVETMEEGVAEVQRGTTEAARSGEALQEILDQINEVTGQIGQIATAAEEQTATTREIAGNIQQITEIVRLGARSSEELSSASTRLSGLSVEMQEMVRHFRV